MITRAQLITKFFNSLGPVSGPIIFILRLLILKLKSRRNYRLIIYLLLNSFQRYNSVWRKNPPKSRKSNEYIAKQLIIFFWI